VLGARPATAADVPADLRRDYVLPDGRARIQVVPKAAVGNSDVLRRFVQEVRAVAPDAGGPAIAIISTSDTIIRAFKDAALGAIAAITLILLLALRKFLDAALVLAPLLLSAAMTVVVVKAAGMSLNYANIIALPLLLGVGVSFNIYFVMNWRAGTAPRLTSATTRAVVFSALTTGTAFGSLALSAHPGTASMGTLLLISLACTLVATLIFVPALLGLLAPAK
jgi:predicted RND superfamily exporter protein